MTFTRPILTAEHVYDRPSSASLEVATWAVLSSWPTNVLPIQIPDHVCNTSTPAMVYQGTWVAACPTCVSVAQATSPNDRRFFCTNCLNAADGNRWLQVEWPDDYRAVEAPLLHRPNPANRNWSPVETVEELWIENLSFGLPHHDQELTQLVEAARDTYLALPEGDREQRQALPQGGS